MPWFDPSIFMQELVDMAMQGDSDSYASQTHVALVEEVSYLSIRHNCNVQFHTSSNHTFPASFMLPPPFDLTTSLHLEEVMSEHMYKLFQRKRQSILQDKSSLPPLQTDLLLECKAMTDIMVEAWMRPLYLLWSIAQYASDLGKWADGYKSSTEAAVKKFHPPLYAGQEPMIMKPAIFVDIHGTIAGWYLPALLKPSRQVGVIV
ncbi:hypothetical protein JAAARDRAFT_50653 [Jaapia argillacea MUCL 33604]|uniref:Uncharacterized protein n=1 Tax=Jaapia argillacea MUCL 33604 TaxID=933084 RepID=A0A067P9D7_9AGAM|nr:hypothetical protein JAAARDRAFT_50653 [Jaapia argillacea MUCL 33604]